MRTQISSEDAARIYKSAGGAYDQNDAVGVCVPLYTTPNTAYTGHVPWRAGCQAGLTVDSGIAERCKNLYSLLEAGFAYRRQTYLAGIISRSSRPVQSVARIRIARYQPVQIYTTRNSPSLRGRT